MAIGFRRSLAGSEGRRAPRSVGGVLAGDVSETCDHYEVVSGGGAYSLAADESLTVTVRFRPAAAGTHGCSIETGQAKCSDVACTGDGADVPACLVQPASIDFGSVFVWDYRDTTFSITNTGTDLRIANCIDDGNTNASSYGHATRSVTACAPVPATPSSRGGADDAADVVRHADRVRLERRHK